jgi:hypothetical protein
MKVSDAGSNKASGVSSISLMVRDSGHTAVSLTFSGNVNVNDTRVISNLLDLT